MNRRHDEFSVHLRWRSLSSGSYPRPDVPGFYLTAGWANAGTADYPIEDYRLNTSQFRQIMAVLDGATGCDGTFANAASVTVCDAEAAVEGYKQRLRDNIAGAQARLSALERHS